MKNLLRVTALTAGAVALALSPTAVAAHEGNHPFKNCEDAYTNGASNVPAGDPHYGTHLDRDGDGVGCDNPESDFVAQDWKHDEKDGEEELAETGGNAATPYIAAAGGAVLLGGAAGLVIASKRRRAER